jgi:hypothetical protein
VPDAIDDLVTKHFAVLKKAVDEKLKGKPALSDLVAVEATDDEPHYRVEGRCWCTVGGEGSPLKQFTGSVAGAYELVFERKLAEPDLRDDVKTATKTLADWAAESLEQERRAVLGRLEPPSTPNYTATTAGVEQVLRDNPKIVVWRLLARKALADQAKGLVDSTVALEDEFPDGVGAFLVPARGPVITRRKAGLEFSWRRGDDDLAIFRLRTVFFLDHPDRVVKLA